MKVSVITPSFNQGRFIEKTLLSVSNQKNVNLEHVVIDGGSTDETVSILQATERLSYWISEPDKGQAHAVNKGIEKTSGEIIGWLNSDDIYYENAISTVIKFFYENPNIDVVYGKAEHIDEEGVPFETYPTEPWSFRRLKKHCFICQPALFFRRHIIHEHGLLNEKLQFCMDYEYWLRLGKKGVTFAYLNKKIAGSRLYPQNKTLGSKVKVHREINNMFKDLLGSVPNRWIVNYAHVVAEVQINRRKNPVRFISVFLLSSFSAILYWKGKITFFEKSVLGIWLKNKIKLIFHVA